MLHLSIHVLDREETFASVYGGRQPHTGTGGDEREHRQPRQRGAPGAFFYCKNISLFLTHFSQGYKTSCLEEVHFKKWRQKEMVSLSQVLTIAQLSDPKLSGSSCLAQQRLSQHASSIGTTSGSGEPKLPQSAPSSSRSASTSTASSIQGPEP